MTTSESMPDVVVIVGPTASGKTALAITVAERFDGEVISGDSRQVYRGLDLGTGKVTAEEMRGVPHHLLDVADPADTYTVAEFTRDGREAISQILTKEKLPIVAGGSFFYIDSLLGKVVTPNVPPNPELRARLEKISTESLYNALLKQDPRRAEDIDPHNKHRLVRALEIVEAHGVVPDQTPEPIYNTLTIGIDIDKATLRENIQKRIEKRVEKGMIEEVAALHSQGVTFDRMEELGLEYRYIAQFLQGKITKEKMLETLATKTWQFAKRQLTWLKRDTDIHWFAPDQTEAVCDEVERFRKPGH